MNYATYLSHIAPKRALWWLSGSQQSVWWEVQRPGLLCPSPATNQLSVLEIIFNLAGSLLPSSKISAIPSSHKVLWYCAFLSHRARSFDIREMMINCHQGTSASHRPESSESLVTTPLSHLAHILHLGRPLWLSFLCSLPEQRPLDGWPSLFLLSHQCSGFPLHSSLHYPLTCSLHSSPVFLFLLSKASVGHQCTLLIASLILLHSRRCGSSSLDMALAFSP